MFGVLFQSSDVVSTSFAAATVATFSTALLCLLGMTWVSERWRIPLAITGIAVLASAFHYLDASDIWLHSQQMTAAHRYVGWFTVQPMQIAAMFFFARTVGEVPVGVFFRMTGAAILMVLSRYLGNAGIFNPTLGVLLSIAFWLYILGEMYFGPMAEALKKTSRPARLGYFWVRLIMTIGWALYPILYFVDVVIGAGQARPVIVLYTLADLINLITIAMIILAVGGKERY